MGYTISLSMANKLQRASELVVKQNVAIGNAINTLKSITHAPIATVVNEGNSFGLTESDYAKITEFCLWLETKEVPMIELFGGLLNK